MEYIIGILLIISFFALAVYAVKGGNLMMGMLVMAVVWTILPLIGNALVTNPEFIEANASVVNISIVDALTNVFQGGPEGWGSVLVNVIFGSLFGRVLLETGIASTMIRKTVELGGDRPTIICILVSIVTTAMFSSMYGAGAVVAIGVIVLPILISLGIPKAVAAVSFMLSIGAGMFINPVQFSIVSAFFQDADGKALYHYDDTFVRWGVTILAVQLFVTILMILFTMRKQKTVHAWSVDHPEKQKDLFVPGKALISPFIPVLLLIIFNVPIILGFLIGSFYALAVCGRLKNFKVTCRVLNKTFYDGVVDIAPLVGFLLIVPMFNKASALCVPYFNALLGGVIPQNTLIISIAFALLSPLGLFRGPLTMFGCGAATLGILTGIGFPVSYIFPLIFISSTVMNVSCCVTQSWIVWGINYTKVSAKDFLKLSVPTGWIVCVIAQVITYVMFG